MSLSLKRTAIHNLIITKSIPEPEDDIKEGLLIPRNLMELVDIQPFEQIIVTRIGGDNWHNRVYSFVIPGQNNNVEARGSLSHFLNKGDRICIISRGYIHSRDLESYSANEIPIVDAGFDAQKDHGNDVSNIKIFLEFYKKNRIEEDISQDVLLARAKIKRIMLSSLIIGLKVTETYESCLQGSAEIPQNIMEEAMLIKYQGVFVHNISRGGISAETYVVPTPPGVVRSTGAMAKLAKKGEKISISSYKVAARPRKPIILVVGRDNVITKKIEATHLYYSRR